MSTRIRDVLMGRLGELRQADPGDARRADPVDSTRALLVWEPKRIVPSYAVPLDDVDGDLAPAPAEAEAAAVTSQVAGRPVYDPRVPFSIHTTAGEALVLRAGGREAAAFRPSDPALDGHVLLDFGAFDAWYEEDERNLGHPRDPFHRIEIVHSSRQVRVELGGRVLAESSRPYLLFEPPLPMRFYLPPEDVDLEALRPSETRTFCAYKGEASYWSVPTEEDLVWTYGQPLREAAEVTGRLAFFNERVDLVVDGELLERPVTPWSPR